MLAHVHEIYDERLLIERAQQGDRLALRTLYQQHAAAVLRTAILPLVHDGALANDLLADTFVRAIEKLDRYQWQTKGMLPWLVRIAKNLCYDHLRRSRRLTTWTGEHELEAELDVEGLLDHAEQAELARRQVEICLAALSPRYRSVITLRLIEQRTRADAAARLEIGTNTLDVLLCRACKAFRKHWHANFGDAELPPRETPRERLARARAAAAP
jgi:RNA polymerase sigma-70 factor (ECF subfamily)